MEWLSLVQVVASIALMIATIGLWRSTDKYRKATERMATVTDEYKDITAAQLLREIYHEIEARGINISKSPEFSLSDVEIAIKAHVLIIAEKLLGEDYAKKVKIRRKDSEGGGLRVFDKLNISPDKVHVIPAIVWEVIKRDPHVMSKIEYLGEA